jgi:2-polyprenyl-6-methoxyphenol hydroxylase-like FAD-dependent oxidoreductase
VRVLIIGAGIGGLLLAHGLRGAGIDVSVYERHSGTADGLPGYGLHINKSGYDALSSALPAFNWAEFDSTAGYAGYITRFYDEHLTRLAVRDNRPQGQDPRADYTGGRSIGRLELRRILLDGLTIDTGGTEDVVHWGRKFVDYENTLDGHVQANFEDGSIAIGDILVGSDGSNSRVREQYLPQLQPVDTGVLNITGRAPLTSHTQDHIPAELIDGSPNSIVSYRSDWLFISAWLPKPSQAPAPTRAGDPYVVWSYASATDSYPSDVRLWDGERLRDLVRRRIQHWAPELVSIVSQSDLGSVTTIPLRAMSQLKHWPSTRVTLLGDAIHSMTPMAGLGANTALRDATTLRDQLVLAAADHKSAEGAIAAYESEMRAYANKALAISTRNAKAAGSNARLPRAVFRGILRTIEAVPALKRRVFATS